MPTEKRPLNRGERKALARAITRPRGHCSRPAWSILLLAVFVFAGAWRTNAALTLTPATGGAVISADTAGGSYTSLTGPKLAESRRGQIGVGSIILNAPPGFMFNTGNPVTVATTGNIVLSNTTATVTATTIAIGVKTKSTKKSTMTWAGIQVRPTTGTPLATGNLTNSGSASGPAKPGNWGTLKEVAGAATTLAFGTQPSSVSYDFPITPAVTVKILDQYGNIVSNSTTSVTMAIGSNPASGTLSGTLTVNAVNGTATFSTLSINKPGNGYTLTATATGLTGITSSSFDINLYRYVVASGSWANTATWSGTSGGAPGASVPTNGVSVFMGEATTGYTVTIPSGYSATCGAVNLGNLAGTNASILNFASASSSLTVNGSVTMNRPTSGATTTIGLGAGSLTVNGNLGLANHTNSNAANNLLNTVTISTGTLTVGGNLIFGAEQALQSQIVFSGAGTLNLAGAFTLSNSLGTLTPGTGIVNFNGSTAGQTIPIGISAVTYSNLTVNNTSSSGATPSAAITGTQVTGNLSVQSGTFNNGGFAITLASAKNFSVVTDAAFNLTGNSTMVTVSGGGTKNFAATSTVNYAGANQSVTAEAYGNLTLSGSGTKTMPASTISIAGNFTLADGSSVSATAGAAINILGDFTLGANTTFNAGAFTHSVGGDWINNGATFAPGTGTISLNGTNGLQNMWGSDDTTFNNLIVNNSAGVTLGADATVNGTLTLSNGILTTASDQVNVLNTANTAITGAGSSSYVNGTLQKKFATGSGQFFTFPIGGPDKYRPVGLTNLTVTTAGLVAATGIAGTHPNIATSGINPNRNVNWSWTLNDDGVLVVGNYNPTFNFVAGDVDSGADPTQFVVRRFDGTNWSATATGARTSTSTAATGLSVIGDDGSDFAVGDPQASQMIVTLPGQSFTSGSGNSGTASAQTAGNAFNLTLSAVDIFNFIDTSYTGTQTISYSGPANAPNGAVPVYTTSVTFPNGQATGVATTLPKAQTTTITATDGVLPGVASSNLTVAAAATKLVYTTVPVTGTAGTAFTVTIQAQDANGNPASPTSATTITLSKATGGGTLSGTLTGTIPTSGNSVTISTPVYSKADTLTLTATATAGMTSLTPVTSGSIVFTAGAATKLAYVSVPGTATVGIPFSVTVQSQDANGNPANLASTTTISLSKASGSGTLSGTLTGTITSGANSVTISTPVYSKTDTLTLTATASGGVSLTAVTSSGIVFSANTPTKLVYTTVPGSGTAGTPFSVTVQSQDSNGNPANLASTTTITLSKASGGGSLSGTLTGTIANGANSVTISTPVYSKADTLTLTATASGGVSLTPVTSGGIPFSAAAASKLVFITQPGSATVGSIFGVQPVVISQDAYGNNSVSGLASSVTVTLAVTSGGGPLKGTTNLDIGTAAGNGSVAFSNLQIDSAGSKQLTASAGGLTSAVSSSFSVAPASLTITALGENVYEIDGSGIPGYTYRLQASDTSSPFTWLDLPGGSLTADATGKFQYQDTTAAPMRFYRTVYP